MPDRVPFQHSSIPVTGFALGKKINLSAVPADALSSQRAELFVLTAPMAKNTDTVADKNTDESASTTGKNAVILATPDNFLQGALTSLAGRREFNGAAGKSVVVRLPSGGPFEEAALLGLGSPMPDQSTIVDGFDMRNATNAVAPFSAAKLGKSLASLTSSTKAKSAVVYVEARMFSPVSLQAFVESLLIASFPDERFKSRLDAKPPASRLESLVFVVDGDGALEAYTRALDRAREIATGIYLAKELVASPPNYCHPESLAKAAVAMAQERGLSHLVLGKQECIDRKMGAYLAVNQGSMYEPQFIHLTYKPEGEVKRRLAFIGKGICMDTGGYNLKTVGGIETMKMDMGAAAALIGCASVLGSLRPPSVEVHFVIAAAENMIDSTAYRPGDVVTASTGKTIEIGNTDAEGRLTLADALAYVEKEIKPDAMLDCATLTGACIVGLGTSIAAVYSQDDQWMQAILAAARRAGSPIWPMPLFTDYKELNDGKCGDISNCASSRSGGSITAALFLREFVKGTPWAHVDMAGPVYDASASEHTGYGAKLLVEIVMEESKKHS